MKFILLLTLFAIMMALHPLSVEGETADPVLGDFSFSVIDLFGLLESSTGLETVSKGQALDVACEGKLDPVLIIHAANPSGQVECLGKLFRFGSGNDQLVLCKASKGGRVDARLEGPARFSCVPHKSHPEQFKHLKKTGPLLLKTLGSSGPIHTVTAGERLMIDCRREDAKATQVVAAMWADGSIITCSEVKSLFQAKGMKGILGYCIENGSEGDLVRAKIQGPAKAMCIGEEVHE